MQNPPCILYLGGFRNNASQCLKLAGMRRWGAALGWEAVMVERPDSTPENLPSLLRRHHPVGCICAGSGHLVDLPPRLFGKIPVAYLEYPAKVVGAAPNILVDDDAIARMAMRELSAGLPSCYAVVGYPRPWLWCRLRVRAFRKAVAAAGGKCIAFPAVPIAKWEEEEDFEKRLVPWLASLPKGCAIFTVCDDVAMVVTRSARAAGRHIPKELTLLSTDNISETCEAAEPHISSIQLDFERMGFLAASMLGSDGGEGSTVTSIGPLLTARRKSTSGRGRHEPWIMDAIEAIRREACDGLTAAALIARYPVSKRLFTLRFREATGHSVLDEILHVRLEKACTLLARTSTAVGAVPGLCGFSCDRTLDALFRSRFGMSMQRWRKNNAL
jgi:LacI family transcriptional regulator